MVIARDVMTAYPFREKGSVSVYLGPTSEICLSAKNLPDQTPPFTTVTTAPETDPARLA